MQKGLVVTLGVVALVFVVSPGFALAPIISCVPDIIVSDVEQNSQTDDLNFFIFYNALDFDDLVRDADNASTEIRWCFIETSAPGNTIEINGRVSNPAVNVVEPGADDLRAINQFATIKNVAWYGLAGTTATQSAMIELFASDGTGTDSAVVSITTVNDSTVPFNDGTSDGLDVPTGLTYTFDTAQGWAFYAMAPYAQPTNSVAGGALVMEEAPAQTPLVYGTWESTKDPAQDLGAKFGCVMRARFLVRSSVTGQACPGFRMRALWYKVYYESSVSMWLLNFGDQDFNTEQQVTYGTFDGLHISGREPGSPAKQYTLLFYPEQTDTLETTGVVYIAFDLLDTDTFPGANDAGILYLDQVDVDWFDNPAIGKGRAEANLSWTGFTGWADGRTTFAAGANITGLTVSRTATEISIAVTSSNWAFEAFGSSHGVGQGVPLDEGRYYRATYMVTSTQTPGGPFGPTVRGAINSSAWVFGNTKDLPGGGLLSAFDSTERPYHVWLQAPSDSLPSTQTEPMQVIFESWLGQNPNPFFPSKPVQGTVRCHEIVTESWDSQTLKP